MGKIETIDGVPTCIRGGHMSRHTFTLVLSFALVGCGAAAESDPEDDAAEDVDTTEEALGDCNCTPGTCPQT
jgi:hypothetical protein